MRRSGFLAGVAALAAAPALARTGAPARSVGPDAAALRRAMAQVRSASKLPSLACALVHRGRIVAADAVGWADAARRIRASVDTPYALASVTKPIVATAAMILHERGRLDLAGALTDDFAAAPRGATVRHLLEHSAGLATYARIAWQGQTDDPPPFDTVLAEHAFAAQPPGTLFEYANLGYGLLGRLLERRSGRPLDALLQQTLFGPLGMHRATLRTGYGAPPGLAVGHDGDGRALPAAWNDTPGAGNVVASVRDLARFALFHLGRDRSDVLSAAARRRMWQHRADGVFNPYYGGARYGLGWYVRDAADGGPLVWHEGGMPGASALLMMRPRSGTAVAVLVNAGDAQAPAQELAHHLLRSVDPRWRGSPLEATDGLGPSEPGAGWRGRWRGEITIGSHRVPMRFEFNDDGTAVARFPGADRPPGLPAQAPFEPLVAQGLLLGTLKATLPAPGVRDGYLLLRLVRRGDALDGAVVAYATPERLEHLLPYPAAFVRDA